MLVLIWLSALGFFYWLRAPLFSLSFPSGDGGMFAVLIKDLQQSQFFLPEFTTFNGGQIPFTYPPLSFYLAAALSFLFGFSPEQLLAVLPALFFAATLSVLIILYSRFSSSVVAILLGLAPWLFLIPLWYGFGGGLSRGLGLFFATTSLLLFVDVFLFQQFKRWPLLSVCAAGACLSHLESAVVIACGYLCFGLFSLTRFDPRTVMSAAIRSLLLLGGLTAPWALLVFSRHGLAPWIAAAETGIHVGTNISLHRLFDFSLFGPVWLTALLWLGLLVALGSIHRVFLAWFLLLPLALGRSFPMSALLGGSVLVVIGVQSLFTFLEHKFPITKPRKMIFQASTLVLLFFALANSSSPHRLNQKLPLYPHADGTAGPSIILSEAWRNSLQKLSTVLLAQEEVVVISDWEPDRTMWFCDWPAEWLPYYAPVRVLNLVQGLEWVSAEQFFKLRQAYFERYKPLTQCKTQGYLPQSQKHLPTLVLARSNLPNALEFKSKALECGYTLALEDEMLVVLRAG